MKLAYEWVKIIAALIFLLTICALSTMTMVKREGGWKQPPVIPDVISVYLSRFEEVHWRLPPHSTLCYIASGNATVMDYYLAQYALAPVVVSNNQPCELWLGNSIAGEPLEFHQDLVLVHDFGRGVKLFRKSDR